MYFRGIISSVLCFVVVGCASEISENHADTVAQEPAVAHKEYGAHHLQHRRFAKHIRTEYRDLSVPADFTLIDEYDDFMYRQNRLVAGKAGASTGWIEFQSAEIKINECTNDLIATTTAMADKTGHHGLGDIAWRCYPMLAQKFLDNPRTGVTEHKQILLGWLDSGLLENINSFGRTVPARLMDEWPYAISSTVPRLLSHYAFYHRSYGFDVETHQKIVRMGEAFYRDWNYYPFLTRGRDFARQLCNLKSNVDVVVNTNDHCGSFNARMALGGILFGLEFNSQISFDTGIRHLEIMLATFDADGVYLAQAERGICAVGYMKQFVPTFAMLDYVFAKAFGLDFKNTKNINGSTPLQAYEKLWEIAFDPLQVVKYWNGHDQLSCSGNGQTMRQMIAKLERNPSLYRELWNGFSPDEYVLSAPHFAKLVIPNEWARYKRQGRIDKFLVEPDTLGMRMYLLHAASNTLPD